MKVIFLETALIKTIIAAYYTTCYSYISSIITTVTVHYSYSCSLQTIGGGSSLKVGGQKLFPPFLNLNSSTPSHPITSLPIPRLLSPSSLSPPLPPRNSTLKSSYRCLEYGKLSLWGPVWSPGCKIILAHFKVVKCIWWQCNVNDNAEANLVAKTLAVDFFIFWIRKKVVQQARTKKWTGNYPPCPISSAAIAPNSNPPFPQILPTMNSCPTQWTAFRDSGLINGSLCCSFFQLSFLVRYVW